MCAFEPPVLAVHEPFLAGHDHELAASVRHACSASVPACAPVPDASDLVCLTKISCMLSSWLEQQDRHLTWEHSAPERGNMTWAATVWLVQGQCYGERVGSWFKQRFFVQETDLCSSLPESSDFWCGWTLGFANILDMKSTQSQVKLASLVLPVVALMPSCINDLYGICTRHASVSTLTSTRLVITPKISAEEIEQTGRLKKAWSGCTKISAALKPMPKSLLVQCNLTTTNGDCWGVEWASDELHCWTGMMKNSCCSSDLCWT